MNPRRSIAVGTRASALALVQARMAKQALAEVCSPVPVRLRKITTTGDRFLEIRLAAASLPGGERIAQGLFTKELEQALLEGRIDVAVHSLKDLPTTLPDGLKLAAVLPRADTADMLLSKQPQGLDGLKSGAMVATSSERRRLQLLHLRPDLRIVEVRGNIATRIRKLREAKEWDAMVLASAGLVRLGLITPSHRVRGGGERLWVTRLDHCMLPAAGQGAIGLEARADDEKTGVFLRALDHAPTHLCVRAERELLRLLGGGCHMPVGAAATLQGEQITLRATVFESTDKAPREATRSGVDPELLALEVWRALYEK